jgi:hypothetical protein
MENRTSPQRMKVTTNVFALVIVTLLMACEQNASDNEQTNIQSDTTSTNDTEKRFAKKKRQNQLAKDGRIDSLRLDIALKNAFKIAETAFGTGNFTKQYELHPDDSSYAINIEILIGKLFQGDQDYFLLRRHVPWATYLDLYKLNNSKIEQVIKREQGGMTYVRDTIFDVNGDGHKDFLVHWYPASGCCRRDIYSVYLKQTDKEKFTHDYEFINQTFSAKEKIIRGIQYGHPGEVGLYKYSWNGLEVDTIEFIYPDVSVPGQFIKTRKEAYRPTTKEGKVLKEVPKEYLAIESYEWFADF